MIRGQLPDHHPSLFFALLPHDTLIGGFGFIRYDGQHSIADFVATVVRAPPVDRAVSDDRRQPCHSARSRRIEPCRVIPGLDKANLENILGTAAIAGDAVGDGQKAPGGGFVHTAKRGCVPATGRDQIVLGRTLAGRDVHWFMHLFTGPLATLTQHSTPRHYALPNKHRQPPLAKEFFSLPSGQPIGS